MRLEPIALSAAKSKECGGKADGLILLSRNGYAVPTAICFSLVEIHSMLSSHCIEFDAALAAVRRWVPGEAASPRLAVLRESILNLPEPSNWSEVLREIRASLGDALIARSSMSAEDAVSASLAGCFESHGCTSETAWSAVRRVLASAYAPGALRRLLEEGVDPGEFRAGVLIQKNIHAQAAGVSFSRDPGNVWEKSAFAEWSGAGEDVVQGRARTSIAIEGSTTSDAQFLDELWFFTKRAERILGSPADLEWVWDGGKLWFVQARVIATPEALLAGKTRKGGRWSRELTLERFPEAMTPMGWSILQDSFKTNLSVLDRDFGLQAKRPDDVAVSLNGIIYSDPEFFTFPGGLRVRWLRYVAPWRPAFWALARALLRRCAGVFSGGRRIRAALGKLELVTGLLGRQAGVLHRTWDEHRARGLERLEEFKHRLRESDSSAEILAEMEALKLLSNSFMEPDLAIFLIKDTYFKALFELGLALGLSESELLDATGLSVGNRTLEMSAEWKEVAGHLRFDPGRARFLADGDDNTLEAPAREAWRRFLSRNGHSTTSWDVAVPSWGENPRQLLPLLRASIQSESRIKGRGNSVSEKARQKFVDALRARGFHRSSQLVEDALDRVVQFMRMDEEQHFLSGLLLEPSRALIVMGARVLLAQGTLTSVDDVFFLELNELKDELRRGEGRNLSWLCAKRRSIWERAKTTSPAPELPRGISGRTPIAGLNGVAGLGVSPGIAEGRLHFAEHLADIEGLPRGAILVTTSPNPALTPVYPLLSGMIAATGGPLAHGFVAAREYGLPAVSKFDFTQNGLKPGMRVQLDGTTGEIRVLDEVVQ